MTTIKPPELDAPVAWLGIDTGDEAVAVAERGALGTSARVAVWPPDHLDRALAAVDRVLTALDVQASRFREDSEISWIHRGNGGLFMLSDGLTEAVSVALEAARWTGGLVDPTVGEALIALGYDRDFAAIDPDRNGPPEPPQPAPGWSRVRLNGPLLELPARVRLDLGATAKGLGSDRSARAAWLAGRQAGGVLVSLGGDIAVAGQPPPAAGRSSRPTVQRSPAHRGRSWSGWPLGPSRPQPPPAAGGDGEAGCCTTSWTRGRACLRADPGRRSARRG